VDIGYHFLVGENGKVYEGRGWDRQGAHSPGWNNDAYGNNFYPLFTPLNFYLKVFVLLVILVQHLRIKKH
jgi:N-acetylmuramoyl-L-alanine amidase